MTMPDLVTRALLIRGIDEQSRTADFVASTDAIDSYGDVVEQKWRLERYLANPVVLFAHNGRDLPIGQCVDVRLAPGGGELLCTIRFATAEANPLAENVWQSVRQKTLRAVSVGFLPHDVRYEKRGDRDVCVLSDNELYEISVTPIPANPEALARMRARALGAAQPHNAPPGAEDTMPAPAPAPSTDDTTTKALEAAEQKTAELELRLEGLTAQNAALVAERDAALARADVAEAAVVEHDVTALVGVKITAAEKDTFVKLARKDRSLFDELVAQRSAMTLLERDPAGIGGDKLPATAEEAAAAEAPLNDGGAAFARLAKTLAAAQR